MTVDDDTEFPSKAMDHWTYPNGVRLDFDRPGRPVENGYIEDFNLRLRYECLNVEVFFTLSYARRKSALWLDDYHTTGLTQHRQIESWLSLRPPGEVEMTATKPPDGKPKSPTDLA